MIGRLYDRIQECKAEKELESICDEIEELAMSDSITASEYMHLSEALDDQLSYLVGVTTMADKLKSCPFCGGKIRIVVCDYEGNIHDTEYEKDPWSGLGYLLYHYIADVPDGEECPIAVCEYGRALGRLIYDTREEAIKVWNKRVDNDRRKAFLI